ncbi:protein kinase [Sphaerisporangium melleum]|uniref:non-specific serine/threonine protein kinase n=1 Tax=Sphaerisporangium melleum TaxID=321316 RepID=A0A917VK55_9ACTN|nr:serine/threonine protein kinase [Sphaerisporangium melleum]GGK89304.1 protein kinase [Sphaerisporangium melleum]GII72481.1 protein kinase [Sphaerisporangium melleum]
MAQLVGGGPPVNDAERKVIAHLRDHAPDDWRVLHNIEIPVHGSKYEVDLVVVTGHSVCLIDVKGTRGRIKVAGRRWYTERRAPFGSPVAKLRGHARALKGKLAEARPALSRVYVDALVVLTADDARLIDPDDRPEAEANDVTTLSRLIETLSDVSRVRTGLARDVTPYRRDIIEALDGAVREPAGPLRFGNWVVRERLGGTDEVTEYRAVNATVASSETVLLRVYQADPFQPEELRAAERVAIANAYEVLTKMPPSEYIVGRRDFFPEEDESRFVLVLDDVRGQALHLRLNDPRQPLTADAKLGVIRDILRGLAHAHRFRVIHRALTPAAVLVTGGGRALLTGFDYARPEDPRSHTVVHRLAEALDPAYVAPECQTRAQAMSRASDVYAAGVIAFQLLTGELPFATSADQFEKGSVLPEHVMTAAGVPEEIIELLRRLCALAPSARPEAAEALRMLQKAMGGDGGRGGGSASPASGEEGPDYKHLPEGYPLTRAHTVRRKLGSGTFGVVYQVYDHLASTDRVVKLVLKDRESLTERLKQEYQVLRGLSHPNVVKVEHADYLPNTDIPYLVFEYVDGQDVHDLIKGRPLGPADAVKLGRDVAEGLVYLHANGIYHCDIKPRNLLRTDTGCKIIDFNVSVTADSSLSRAGGTGKYAPPDTGVGPPTVADLADRDVYGLGLTIYELVTGQWPFRSPQRAFGEQPIDPTSLTGLGDLSDALVATLMKAIAPLRGDRYASAAELLAALTAIGDQVHRPRLALPPEPSPRGEAAGGNPFVAHLQTLYSQSTISNAGTRGHDPFKLYVPTALDERLIPDVVNGRHTLVVITGNAGDGKTAFLEHLISREKRRGAVAGEPRDNGADVRLPGGRWLRTNHDGSQDEGDKANDDVLLEFFAPYAGTVPAADTGETRLIAINEGRLIDFLATHEERFPWLAATIRAGLSGEPAADGVAVVNLNRRSVVAGDDESIFDRVLGRMTHEGFWEACDSCELVKICYAPHNARTFAHPSAGPKVTARLRDLYTLAHLRGHLHMTLRDLRSGLAFMLTSGRGCEQIRELYREGDARAILDGFYFNSWAGAAGTKDRLLAFLREVDVAAVPDPALDRQIDYVGPDAGQAVMTVDQRGAYDVHLLDELFTRLPRSAAPSSQQVREHRGYVASARRRFYFECVDDRRARRLLPYRSAHRFLEALNHPERVTEHLPEIIGAINRGEGLPDPGGLGDVLALQIRQVPGGGIRSYRLFPAETLSLATTPDRSSPYLEEHPEALVLGYHGEAGHRARLRIRLDLYELLFRLREGHLPGVAERQGLYLALTIFKNELSAAPYQEVLLTMGGRDLYRIHRAPSGRLRMRSLTEEGER